MLSVLLKPHIKVIKKGALLICDSNAFLIPRMILSKQTLSSLKERKGPDIPAETIFSLPEKVLQFGTGVLLRGLPDYFIDKANKQGVFNGRIVIVKSTNQGDANTFNKQDNLYTQCVRGTVNGEKVEENIINASVSRVLAARDEWNEILKCAGDPQLQIIISNTTEVGIALLNNDDVNDAPPVSFPGKLLSFLFARYKKFNGSAASGMVIIPTELITENGSKLKNIVVELARQNQLNENFIEWLKGSNDFCNSLVDRIVPGKLTGADKTVTEEKLGYTDDLMIMSEVYGLWAIETADKRTIEILSFSKSDEGVVIASDINKHRELKLRLLNGSHTFSCALAMMLGFTTVKQAMSDPAFVSFITNLMMNEIVPAIVNEQISLEAAQIFSRQVLDRYKNPFIEHQWQSISLQYSSKMKMRNVPLLLQHYNKKESVPGLMALGFAAYLLFMQSDKNDTGAYTCEAAGRRYTINDDKAARLYELWRIADTDNFVMTALQDKDLWGTDLSALTGFAAAISTNLVLLQSNSGVSTALNKLATEKIILPNETNRFKS
jgi:tagaturonate reductase